MKPGRILLWLFAALLLVVVAALGVRALRALQGPALQPWHTHVPVELTAQQIDASDWQGYLAQERAIFDDIRANVTQRLEPEARVPYNRYFEGSPVYPPRFSQDWNRSYVIEPAGSPQGAVVLLHGLTDSPYSLRHVARRYADRGFVAIGIRIPGHGTVPAGLTDVRWEDWSAAARLAIREARRRAPAPAPLHLVGFSNGGALAVKYALDAIEDPKLPARRSSRAVHADDRHHALCAVRRAGRASRRAAAVRERRLAQQPARIQSIQVQLVPGQRRAAVVPPDGRVAGADPAPCPRRTLWTRCPRC